MPSIPAALLDKHEMAAVCSLGLPDDSRPTNNPDKALEFLKMALDKTAAMGAKALSGVVYGSIGERTGKPPTQAELDSVAAVMEKAAAHARKLNLELGLEAVNRYENHMLNTADQTISMVERIGAGNIFVHLDTYHMNIEEKGVANGIIRARDIEIHPPVGKRPGHAGTGTVAWDEVFGALAAIGFKGGMAMESFIELPPADRLGALGLAPGGARRRKCWTMACRSCATRRGSTG